jgi:hypothetical protein
VQFDSFDAHIAKAAKVRCKAGGTGGGPNLQLHPPLGDKVNHLVQEIGIRSLLHERARRLIMSSVIDGSFESG